MVDGELTLSSSRPSSAKTTMDRRLPLAPSTPAILGAIAGSLTPTSWRRTRAGLARGPRKLKTVGTPSSPRTGPANRMAGWKRGAKQKPMPTSATHRATPTGPRSTATPKASSTSAVPTEDEAARLPCLHTGAPAPAVMQAAMVETLMLRSRSPPVPTTSTGSPSTSHRLGVGQHGAGEAGHLLHRLALGPQGHQEARRLGRRGPALEDLAQHATRPHRRSATDRRSAGPARRARPPDPRSVTLGHLSPTTGRRRARPGRSGRAVPARSPRRWSAAGRRGTTARSGGPPCSRPPPAAGRPAPTPAPPARWRSTWPWRERGRAPC